MRATYNRFLTFGVAYRYNDAVSAMIGATFRNFFLGYSYDYPLSAIGKVSSGSHEIVAGYQLKLDFRARTRTNTAPYASCDAGERKPYINTLATYCSKDNEHNQSI